MNKYLTRPATPAAIRIAKGVNPVSSEMGLCSERYSFAPMSVEEITQSAKGPNK